MESFPNTHEANKKEIFMISLQKEVQELVLQGRLTEEQAKEKIESASKIEESIPDDIDAAAKLFAISGVADEEELIKHLS